MNSNKPGWKSQFGNPSGTLGKLIGHLMAIKNAEINDLAIEKLNADTADRILEVGFGHGRTIHRIAKQATEGFIAGVDRSEVMIAQAGRRNRAAVRTGRVELHLGTASKLPFDDGRFSKIIAVNCYQHWDSPGSDLREARRVLEEGGLLLLGLRMKHPGGKKLVAPGFTADGIEAIAAVARDAGFRNVETTLHTMKDRDATILKATK